MRLIDADKVVEYCCGYFGHCTQECIKCGFANSVKDIPTAYNVDKVVKEVWDIYVNSYREILEAVKRGGIND